MKEKYMIKKCPFCGEKPKVLKKGMWFQVSCTNHKCFVQPKVNWNTERKIAIERWNERNES